MRTRKLADHVPTLKNIMALTPLELSATASSEVLEKLVVNATAQATEHE